MICLACKYIMGFTYLLHGKNNHRKVYGGQSYMLRLWIVASGLGVTSNQNDKISKTVQEYENTKGDKK